MDFPDVNYWAVLVAAIAQTVLGGLWYSPVLFGKQWMKFMNIDMSKLTDAMKKEASKAYMWGFVMALIMSYVLAYLVEITGTFTISEGIILSLWIWVGFVAAITINSVLYEKKPIKLWMINAGYYLVGLPIMAAILTAFSL